MGCAKVLGKKWGKGRCGSAGGAFATLATCNYYYRSACGKMAIAGVVNSKQPTKQVIVPSAALPPVI